MNPTYFCDVDCPRSHQRFTYIVYWGFSFANYVWIAMEFGFRLNPKDFGNNFSSTISNNMSNTVFIEWYISTSTGMIHIKVYTNIHGSKTINPNVYKFGDPLLFPLASPLNSYSWFWEPHKATCYLLGCIQTKSGVAATSTWLCCLLGRHSWKAIIVWSMNSRWMSPSVQLLVWFLAHE